MIVLAGSQHTQIKINNLHLHLNVGRCCLPTSANGAIAARLVPTRGLAATTPEDAAATAPTREVTQANPRIEQANAESTEDKDPHKIQIADAESRPGFNLC